MDHSKLGAWTRRRVGLVVGGGIAALAGLSALDDALAKKKRKKKKRCRKLKQPCGGQKKCCKGITCGESAANLGRSCCHQPQGACTEATDCCARALCEDGRCCFDTGGPCAEKADCCAPFDVCDTDNVCRSTN